MLYELFTPFKHLISFFNLFEYITFRAATASILALFISFIIGPWVIHILHKNQIGEEIRLSGPKTHMKKRGTPTMGGVIILTAVLLPTLLFSKINNTPLIGLPGNPVSSGVCSLIFVNIAIKKMLGDNSSLPLLENGIDVFCEKPLSPSLRECELLYQTANANSSKLFVDWVFTFNDAVNHIKKLYHSGKLGGLRNVAMNRLNSGPERKDVSAKWDLASHDVSILHYIANWSDNCDVLPIDVNWNCYRRNPASFVADTCVGSIRYDTFDAIIHSSWEYGRKDRKCIFEFDAGFLEWDDTKNSITLNGKPETFTKLGSPLENSIKTFVEGDFHKQIDLTLTVTETLEHGE